jgi:hypothetical protein
MRNAIHAPACQRWLSIGSQLLTEDRVTRCTATKAAATKALSLAPDYALAHLVLGVVHMITNHAAEGIAECERALVLDRNLADAHACIGWAKANWRVVRFAPIRCMGALGSQNESAASAESRRAYLRKGRWLHDWGMSFTG